MEIVVAEDETNLRAALRHACEQESWSVRDFPDGQSCWEYLRGEGGLADGRRDRVLLFDITMPRMDGLELCRKVRGLDQAVPIIFLSSRDEEFDRILGLEIGADDYLCKPFSVRELLTRIKVLHRRAHASPAGPGGGPGTGLHVDEAAFRVWWHGQEMHLTVSEFRILASLVAIPGTVKTREQLQLAAFPEDNYVNERSVDCHIKRLRRKLESVPGTNPIEAIYGLGYRWQP